MIAEVLEKLLRHEHLTAAESQQVINTILSGSASALQVAAFMTALRMKGETVDEILGAAQAMRAKVTRIHHNPAGVD